MWFQNPETPAMLVEKDRAAAEAVLENNKTYERICT